MSEHVEIVNQAIDYIIDHLFEKITVEEVADVCCFSPFYFNRLFQSVVGESLYRYIKRLRIETAAFKLIKFPHLTITRIATELGYSSSNFTVLFKQFYGVCPAEFRRNPKLPRETAHAATLRRLQVLQKTKPDKLLETMDQKIRFEEFPARTFRYRRFSGNYLNLTPVWEDFCREMETLYPDRRLAYYGISYDDPLIVGDNACLYDLCIEAPRSSNGNYRKIPPGRYLCYQVKDHIRELHRVYNDLFGVWMPHRGYAMDQGVCIERYHTGLGPDGHIELDLCIPLQSR